MTNETKKNYTRKIADANATGIIVIVYELTEIYLEDAIEAHRDGKMEDFVTNVNKATRCIKDLIEALDLQYDISKNLLDIYMFLNKELSLASVKLDVGSVKRVQALITKLKLSFEELAKQDNSSSVMDNAQEVYAGLTYGKGTLNESIGIQSNRGFTV